MYKEKTPGRRSSRATNIRPHKNLHAARMSWKQWRRSKPFLTFEDRVPEYKWQVHTWTEWTYPDASQASYKWIAILVLLVYFGLPVLLAITPVYLWLKSKRE